MARKNPKISAALIEQLLRPLGYTGGHSILQEYVRKVRPQLSRRDSADTGGDHIGFAEMTRLDQVAQNCLNSLVFATARTKHQRTAEILGSADTRQALAKLATPTNFSTLARDFFARLTERYLAYFLSRELSNQLSGLSANRKFREALRLHCRQASKIVEKFAGDWFSKTNYRGGITPKKAAGFVQHALDKLRVELELGAKTVR